jgi:integrase
MSKEGQSFIPLMVDGARMTDFFVDGQSGVIYFLKSVDGKKIKFSTFEKVWSASVRRYANGQLKKKLGKTKTRITPLIKDQLEPWLLVKESEGLDPATLIKIRDAVKRIEPFWGDKFPYEINRDTLAEWYKWLNQTYPGQQKENPIKYLRNFCRYLAEKVVGGIPLLPAVPKISDPDLKEVKAARAKKKLLIFSGDDFQKIYRAGDEQEKLVCLFMYTMATRIEETLTLRFGHEIIMGDQPIYRWGIGQNKADHVGEHLLHSALIEPFTALYKLRLSQGTDLLFPQQRNNKASIWAAQIDWAGWEKRADIGWHWTSHTFRHTCLSNLFNDERNPQALICKQYRVSLKVAIETYVKGTKAGIEKISRSIEVSL